MAEVRMSAYDDIDEAFENAVASIDRIIEAQGWSDAQADSALYDAQEAYEDNSGYLDSASTFVTESFDLDTNLLNIADNVGIDQASRFWKQLYASAKTSWGSYPNGSQAIAWLASASGAATTAMETADENSTAAQATDVAVASATDIAAIGTTVGNIAKNPATWYGLAAAALLGIVVVIRGRLF